MGRHAKIITALATAKLQTPGLHFVGGVPNLALRVSAGGGRSWVLRLSVGNKRRDMGLGPFPEVSLATARNLALDNRALLRQGIDPVKLRQDRRKQAAKDAMKKITFREAATSYILAQSAGWKGTYQAYQWTLGMRKHVFPIIGTMCVGEIALTDVLKVIEPLWQTKVATGSRIRGQLEAILSWATTRQYRTGNNPARWKGNLDTLLPARNKVTKVRHHESLAWEKCAAFYQSLDDGGIASRALMLCILTACRSGEIRGARWPEFDLAKAIWTIPSERMKAGKEHRVPLAPEAVGILESIPRFANNDLVFQTERGKQLTSISLLEVVRNKMGRITVHGFRSTFRVWAAEETSTPREVMEQALAHGLKDKTEAAYARSDLFEKRSVLMEAWAKFLCAS